MLIDDLHKTKLKTWVWNEKFWNVIPFEERFPGKPDKKSLIHSSQVLLELILRCGEERVH